MKKVTAIVFFIVLLLATTHISELFKLNTFIKHYIEHMATDPGLSVTNFIVLHYMTNNGHTADNHEGLKLPFKNLVNHHHTNLTLDQPAIAVFLKPQIKTIVKKFSRLNLTIPADNFTHNIWQPPRA